MDHDALNRCINSDRVLRRASDKKTVNLARAALQLRLVTADITII